MAHLSDGPERPVPAILAIDIGLTNCKVLIFGRSGDLLAREVVPYPTLRPAPDRVEQEPRAWLGAVATATKALRLRSPQVMGGVVGIAITAHMHSVVCVGQDGEAIGNAIVLGDMRALEQAQTLADEVGARTVYQLTGSLASPSAPAAIIRWLHDNEPERHSRSHVFMSCKDYVRSQLTGVVATDPIDACGTSLFDVRKGLWSREMMAACFVSSKQLPVVLDPRSSGGALVKSWADVLGLPSGMPLIVGCGDDVEIIGNGLLQPRQCLEHLGTTGSILAVAERPLDDEEMSLELYPHPIEGLWVVGGSTTMAGAAVDWAYQALGMTGLAQALDSLKFGEIDHDDPLFLPHLSGMRAPELDPLARGAWVGMRPATGGRELMRAAYEGVAYSLRSILDRTSELIGVQGPIVVAAPGPEWRPWISLRADAYGRPLQIVDVPEPTGLGVSLLAMVGLGLENDLDDLVARAVRSLDVVQPRREVASLIEKRYQRYRDLVEVLASPRFGH